MKERHEQRATDDRPQDRKRITAHTENEGLGEVELPRDPRSEQSADEPDGGGHQESAARSAAQRPADSTANRGNNDQDEEPWQRQLIRTSLG
jgi:hypothetical protein